MIEASKTKSLRIAIAVFCAVQAVLYLCFACIDIGNLGDSSIIKYVTICLCFAFSFTAWFFARKITNLFFNVAFAFTLVADAFLLLGDGMEWGVSAFIVTQACYFAALLLFTSHSKRRNGFVFSLCARVIVFALVCLVLILLSLADFLLIITAFYFINLVANTIYAFRLSRDNKLFLVLAIGYALFICCDVCVGLHNASVAGIALPRGLSAVISMAIWLFYLPSQVLIAVFSLLQARLITQENTHEVTK